MAQFQSLLLPHMVSSLSLLSSEFTGQLLLALGPILLIQNDLILRFLTCIKSAEMFFFF